MIWLRTISASVFVRGKKDKVCGNMEIPKLDQTEGRNGLVCKNVQLSLSKATAVSEEKMDK